MYLCGTNNNNSVGNVAYVDNTLEEEDTEDAAEVQAEWGEWVNNNNLIHSPMDS